MNDQERIAWLRERYGMLKERSNQLLGERNKLREEVELRDKSFAMFFRHYSALLDSVENGPDKADLTEMIREQARLIGEYQKRYGRIGE